MISKFNSNEERRLYWAQANQQYPAKKIEEALATMKPDTANVLRLHYHQGMTLKEIGAHINRSMTVVRNHHNRGIYLLHKYLSMTEREREESLKNKRT